MTHKARPAKRDKALPHQRPADDDRLVELAVRRVRNGDVVGALRLLQQP
jgi:hypothetical protein